MEAGSVRRVGVVLKTTSADAVVLGRRLIEELGRLQLEAVLDTESAAACGLAASTTRAALAAQVDLVVVLGGDGTLLSVAHGELGRTPILGVNMGTLGFLTEHPAESLFPVLHACLAGQVQTQRRDRLAVEVLSKDREPIRAVVLNDAVINKSALARMVLLSIHVDEQFVTRLRADGLIVATPTGSTAYSMSAGGPILHPTLDAIVVTPICPHALTHRPIALSLDCSVEVRLESHAEEVYLTLDGQAGFPLTSHDVVRIRRSKEPLLLITDPARSYFQILNHKLKWGEWGD